MMRKILYIVFSVVSLAIFGQQPIINSISPTHVEVGGTVTISGANLGGRVFFGGVEATSISGAGNVIEAVVPPGVTHGAITVLNNSLIAQSPEQFYISFGGTSSGSFDVESITATNEVDAYDICLCDLDSDGLNDIAISHNVGLNTDNEISIFENQSTAGTTNFGAPQNIGNADNLTGFISTTCGDLDNDGKPELIFTSNDGTNVKHIYIYENVSGASINMSFVSGITLLLPDASSGNRVPRRVKVADMDGDGHKDLVVGNEVDNAIHIFRNTSSGDGNFSFATPDEINAGSGSNVTTGSLDIADLNNDNLPDIVTLPFDKANERIYVLKNTSVQDKISFELEDGITTSARRVNLALGDFDEDGLIDIAATDRQNQQVAIFENTTSGADITFTDAATVSTTSVVPWGIDLGDINGDGKLDIVVACLGDHINVIENTSTGSTISFASAVQLTTTSSVRNICVGDLNQDAKPDIAFTHNVNLGALGNLGAFINRNCISPVISPLGLNFCTGTSFRLFATNALDATYNWTITSGTGTGGGNTGANNFSDFNFTSTSATIQVTVTQSNTACSTPTATETFSLNASVTTDPTINVSQAGIVCAGDPLTLSSSTTNSSYQWTLPDGTTATTSTINIASLSSSDAGEYKLRVQNDGSCASAEVTRTIVVSTPPSLQILNNGNDNFCNDGANDPQLEVSSIAGLTYQWKRDGTNITGATNATYTADQTGAYSVEITDTNNCSRETSSYSVTELTEPNAALDAASPTETCVDFPTTFTSASTVQSGFTPVNSWSIENASNTEISSGTGDTHVFSFPAVGTYEVILTTTYDPNVVSSCSDMFSQMVTVSDAPTITFDVADDTEKCQGDALTVGVTSPAASEIASYSWTVNGNVTTNATVDATTIIGEDFVYAVVELTTTIGCTVKDSVRIINFPTTADISAADFDVVTNDTVTLEEANSLVLNAENIVSGFDWSPGSIFSDSTASSTTVFPATSMTRVTLTGIDENNCQVATGVTIILDNIRPRKTFSPNGDGINDSWEILNTDALTGCEIFIFDSRGKNIRVASSPFTNNQVWDGTSGGSDVPEGIYYFVLKCDDSSLSKSGSILLAR